MKKKAGITMLISDEIDFETKSIKKGKKGHYIMIKGSIQDDNILNIYTPKIEASKYIKIILTDIKGDIDNNTVILGDFSTPLTLMARSSTQKINKATEVLNDTIDELDLISIGYYI